MISEKINFWPIISFHPLSRSSGSESDTLAQWEGSSWAKKLTSEEGGISPVQLLPSKWNKDDTTGAWRLDVDIHEEDDLDDGLSVVLEEVDVLSSASESEEESVV